MRTLGMCFRAGAAIFLLGAIGGCASTLPRAQEEPERRAEVGMASYYAAAHQGRRTASGERFDMTEMTAAHRTLPFGSRVRVTSLESGRSVIVRINDRGPFRRNRVLDVSYAAARALGMLGRGVIRVRIDSP